jgi:serine phosphatase RsbU (regulator of sigma subunit)
MRIAAPVTMMGTRVGILLSDVFYTQAFVEQYAALTQTGINIFAAQQLSVGTLPDLPGLDVCGFMRPADEVGGDYYDILMSNGILHIGIGDVTGAMA